MKTGKAHSWVYIDCICKNFNCLNTFCVEKSLSKVALFIKGVPATNNAKKTSGKKFGQYFLVDQDKCKQNEARSTSVHVHRLREGPEGKAKSNEINSTKLNSKQYIFCHDFIKNMFFTMSSFNNTQQTKSLLEAASAKVLRKMIRG